MYHTKIKQGVTTLPSDSILNVPLSLPMTGYFWRQLELVAISKKSLSREFASEGELWVSESALIVLGLLACEGTDAHKANVFYRLVYPDKTAQILPG